MKLPHIKVQVVRRNSVIGAEAEGGPVATGSEIQDRRQDAPIRNSNSMMGSLDFKRELSFQGNRELLADLQADEGVKSLGKKTFNRGQAESTKQIADRRETRLLGGGSSNFSPTSGLASPIGSMASQGKGSLVGIGSMASQGTGSIASQGTGSIVSQGTGSLMSTDSNQAGGQAGTSTGKARRKKKGDESESDRKFRASSTSAFRDPKAAKEKKPRNKGLEDLGRIEGGQNSRSSKLLSHFKL